MMKKRACAFVEPVIPRLRLIIYFFWFIDMVFYLLYLYIFILLFIIYYFRAFSVTFVHRPTSFILPFVKNTRFKFF